MLVKLYGCALDFVNFALGFSLSAVMVHDLVIIHDFASHQGLGVQRCGEGYRVVGRRRGLRRGKTGPPRGGIMELNGLEVP